LDPVVAAVTLIWISTVCSSTWRPAAGKPNVHVAHSSATATIRLIPKVVAAVLAIKAQTCVICQRDVRNSGAGIVVTKVMNRRACI
jgi:hypothetical protein